jgi:hypothetical protein
MKFSRADSRIKMLKFSDVSETNSVPIFRVLLVLVINLTTSNTLKMGTVSETSENFHILMRLSAREYFIEFCHREGLEAYNVSFSYRTHFHITYSFRTE